MSSKPLKRRTGRNMGLLALAATLSWAAVPVRAAADAALLDAARRASRRSSSR